MELFMFVPELDQSLQNEDEHEFEEQLFQDKLEEEAIFDMNKTERKRSYR